MSTRTSAARYAKALLDVVVRESDPARAEHDLAAFVDLVAQHPDLQRAFGNPVVSASDKQSMVRQLVERLQPVPPVGKLLTLLAARGRLALLPDLVDVYRDRLMEHQGVLRAEVTTAEPLSPERAAEMRERLARLTGRTVTMSTKVDRGIIAGVVTKIGSTVYDGSMATQLARFRAELNQRA